jgi:hypothetical protein
MDLSKVFSARAITLLVFIFVVLLVGTMFNVKLGPEPFTENAEPSNPTSKPLSNPLPNLLPKKETFTEFTDSKPSTTPKK